MLTISCPQCATKMRAPDEYAGKSAKCGSCGHKFVIDGAPVAEIQLEPVLRPSQRRDSQPPPLKQWHYAADGERKGPVSSAETSSQIASGRITRKTLVWREGMDDWKEAGETELFVSSTPPPLLGRSVPNGIAWVLALLPIACFPILFFGMVSARNDDEVLGVVFLTLMLLLVADFGLFALDFFRLRRAGHSVPSWLWAVPMPVYLFARASTLRQSPDYAYAWILSIALWLLLVTPVPVSLPIVLLCLLLAVILKWSGVGRRVP